MGCAEEPKGPRFRWGEGENGVTGEIVLLWGRKTGWKSTIEMVEKREGSQSPEKD